MIIIFFLLSLRKKYFGGFLHESLFRDDEKCFLKWISYHKGIDDCSGNITMRTRHNIWVKKKLKFIVKQYWFFYSTFSLKILLEYYWWFNNLQCVGTFLQFKRVILNTFLIDYDILVIRVLCAHKKFLYTLTQKRLSNLNWNFSIGGKEIIAPFLKVMFQEALLWSLNLKVVDTC